MRNCTDTAKGNTGCRYDSCEGAHGKFQLYLQREYFRKLSFWLRIRILFILPIILYKRLISPLLPQCCRFTPTCSEYAAEAIMTHGVLKGLRLSAWRLLRCNPFGGFGYDPVPLKNKDKAHAK